MLVYHDLPWFTIDVLRPVTPWVNPQELPSKPPANAPATPQTSWTVASRPKLEVE